MMRSYFKKRADSIRASTRRYVHVVFRRGPLLPSSPTIRLELVTTALIFFYETAMEPVKNSKFGHRDPRSELATNIAAVAWQLRSCCEEIRCSNRADVFAGNINMLANTTEKRISRRTFRNIKAKASWVLRCTTPPLLIM